MKKLLFLWVVFLAIATSATAQVVDWVKSTPSSGSELYNTSLATDGKSLVTFESFSGTITLGTQTFTSTSSADYYLARYDLNNNIIWAKHFKGKSSNAYGSKNGIATDYNGNIFIIGQLHARPGNTKPSELTFDNVTLQTDSSAMISYLIKFDKNGVLQWVRSLSDFSKNMSNSHQSFAEIGIDAAGNVYLAGSYANKLVFHAPASLTIDNAPLTVILLKYDTNGNRVWIKNFPNPFDGWGMSLAVTPAGNSYLWAKYTNTPVFDGLMAGTACVVKFNAQGQPLWMKGVSDDPNTAPITIATDASENFYVTGRTHFFWPLNFDNIQVGANLPPSIYYGNYLAKGNANGTWQWIKPFYSTELGATINDIRITPDQKVVVAGAFDANMGIDSLTINAMPAGRRNTCVGMFDTAGNLEWVKNVEGTEYGNGSYGTESVVLDASGIIYLKSYAQRGSVKLGGVLSEGSGGTNYSYAFLAKIRPVANLVTGKVFIDTNGNGVQEPAEKAMPEHLIATSPDQGFAGSDANGNYRAFLDTGTYNLSVHQLPKYYSVASPVHTVTFNTTPQTVSGKDFALVPLASQPDMRVAVTNVSQARPGFDLTYRITYENIGTTVLYDTISLGYDPGLTFVGTTSQPVYNHNGRIEWFDMNLSPMEKRHIDVTFNLPATTALGTVLTAVATAKPHVPDVNPADNLDSLQHVVTGSYDPNDKQVNRQKLTEAVLKSGEYLDYTIRFQNTGTDTAFTVTVTDYLSDKLDLTSLQQISASHPYQFTLQDKRRMAWTFNNILLPDSNRNEAASHGFIRFLVKPAQGLKVADTIPNTAAIYFDFNEPIITNTVTTIIVENPRPKLAAGEMDIFPNPARQSIRVMTDLSGSEPIELVLMDAMGRIKLVQQLPARHNVDHKLELKNLSGGVYMLQLKSGKEIRAKRIVVL